MAEWGYLLKHLDGQYLPFSVFREKVIQAEREAEGERLSLLVDIVLATMNYAGDGWELDKALIAAGYLPKEDEEDD